MGTDLRYKLEHGGDYFVGMLNKIPGFSGPCCRGECASTDLRYKVEHGGDYFVGMIENVAKSARSSAKGVILTYDINKTQEKEDRVAKQIGEHVAQISRENPSFAQDEKLKGLLGQFETLEKKKSGYVAERQRLLYPEKRAVEATMPVMIATMTDMPETA